MLTDAMKLFAMLYPKVRLQPGVKVEALDWSVYRDGTTLKVVEDSVALMLDYEGAQERGCLVLAGLRGGAFEKAVGRKMRPSDMRLAVRPVLELQAAAFLDDVTSDTEAHLMIETSPGSWHAHFVLDRLCTSVEIIKIQKYLRFFFGGDPAAIRSLQPRRIPVPGLGVLVNHGLPPFKADSLLKQYEACCFDDAKRAPVQACSGAPSIFSRALVPVACNTAPHLERPDLDDRVLREQWKRRLSQNFRADKSSADFGLAVYLLKRGWHPRDVRDALLRTSESIVSRKGRNLDFYLDHTVEKAVMSAGSRLAL